MLKFSKKAKLGGVAFLAIGLLLLVLSLVPGIPGFEAICLTTKIMGFIATLEAAFTTFNLTPVLGNTLYISMIIPWIAVHFVIAGFKSMRYEKAKKSYFYSRTKIGLLITGFILICIAFVFLTMFLLDMLDPHFQFIVDLVPTFSYPGLLPKLLIPMVLTAAIIFFIYWIGSKIMKSGVKKEEMF